MNQIYKELQQICIGCLAVMILIMTSACKHDVNIELDEPLDDFLIPYDIRVPDWIKTDPFSPSVSASDFYTGDGIMQQYYVVEEHEITLSNIQVYRYKSSSLANRIYKNYVPGYDRRLTLPAADLNLDIKGADDYIFGCSFDEPDSPSMPCMWIARYTNIIVKLQVRIRENEMSIDDMVKLIQDIDSHIVVLQEETQ